MGTDAPLTPQSDIREFNHGAIPPPPQFAAEQPAVTNSPGGLLYPADVSNSPRLGEALSWVMVEDVQPNDPLGAGCEHAAWIDEVAASVIGEQALMTIAPDVAAHPLVENTEHHDPDVLYVCAPALVHEDIRVLTAAALAARIPGEMALPVAGPPPGAEPSRDIPLMAGIFGLMALLIGAFAAGGWVTNRQVDDGTAAPVALSEITIETTAPSAADQTPPAETATTQSPQATTTQPTTTVAAPTTTVAAAADTTETTQAPIGAVDEGTLAAAAETALAGAGYSGISATYESGTVVLDGVLPSATLGSGYFSVIDDITAVVTSVDGIDTVSPRLFLRGDDATLRAELKAISAEQPIEFPFASAELTPASGAGLQSVAEAILANPGLRVLVAGHTDAAGSPEANAQLAAERAGAVIRQLAALGVPITRLQPVAYGELFPGETASDAENRRVEFEVAP